MHTDEPHQDAAAAAAATQPIVDPTANAGDEATEAEGMAESAD